MTRKRYIKLLMALGITRNLANIMAETCQGTGKSYAAEYRRQLQRLRMAKAARKMATAVCNMMKFFNSGLPVARELQGLLVAHHAQPITPENLEGGKMVIVTKQEHDRLHGYSANVTFVDELHCAGGGGNE